MNRFWMAGGVFVVVLFVCPAAAQASIELTTDPVIPAGLDGWFLSEPRVDIETAGGEEPVSVEYRLQDGWRSYTGPFNVTSGRWDVEVRATDGDGRTTRTTQEVKVDSRPPEVRLVVEGSSLDGWLDADASLRAVATDLDSGVSLTEAKWGDGPWVAVGGPIPLPSDGVHTLRLRATDHAGNPSVETNHSITVDTRPPALPEVAWLVDERKVIAAWTGSFHDAASGLSTVRIERLGPDGEAVTLLEVLDGGGEVPAEAVVDPGPGEHLLRVLVADGVDHEASTAWTRVEVMDAPGITTQVSVHGTHRFHGSLEGASELRLYLDGALVTSTRERDAATLPWDSRTVPDGTYDIRLVSLADDGRGSVESFRVQVRNEYIPMVADHPAVVPVAFLPLSALALSVPIVRQKKRIGIPLAGVAGAALVASAAAPLPSTDTGLWVLSGVSVVLAVASASVAIAILLRQYLEEREAPIVPGPSRRSSRPIDFDRPWKEGGR